MDNERLRNARERLLAERARLQGLLDELDAELAVDEPERTGELSTYDQHPADSGSELFEREKDDAIRASLRDELDEIAAALERVDDGSYGIDEETGDPIDAERLDAIPTARTNIT